MVGVGGPGPFCTSARPASPAWPSSCARAVWTWWNRPAQAEQFWTLESLAKYSAVVLENVPAEKVGMRGMETLAAWVRETGAGLLMTGGRNSYGPGGYYKSPLEPIMPVSMELRNEHRKLSLAMVVALDRSGSMAVPVAGGKVKDGPGQPGRGPGARPARPDGRVRLHRRRYRCRTPSPPWPR